MEPVTVTIPAEAIIALLPDAMKPLVKITGGTLDAELDIMGQAIPVQIVVK